MLILDFNDSELRIADGETVLASAPGIAVLEGSDFILGAAAAAKSRLNPRASYRNFWEQLDQQPLNRRAGKAQTHADIAYFHLRALWRDACAKAARPGEDVIMVVPSQYGAERLSLLLGIARACGIPVQGVVDSAVLAASVAAHACQYIDISLHRVYHSRVDAQGVLQGAQELNQQGLVWCYEQCIKLIAAQFMSETRFDPLHEAASEQRLFDELPQWLAGFASAERLPLSLTAGQRQHRIEVTRAQIVEQLQPLLVAIDSAIQGTDAAVVISHRLAALPGVVERLNAGVMAEGAVFAAAAARRSEVISDVTSPVWVKHLPPTGVAAADLARPKKEKTPPLASHLLHGSCAYKLTSAGLVPGDNLELTEHNQTSCRIVLEASRIVLRRLDDPRDIVVNGQRWQGQERVLEAGDVLELGGHRFQLIHVRDGC